MWTMWGRKHLPTEATMQEPKQHKRQRRCAYCADTATTVDHVFPTSWYPESTSLRVQRWTVPCCTACNNRFSHVEKVVGLLLSMSVDHALMGASGVWDKLSKAAKPSAARTRKEARAREALRQQVLKQQADVPAEFPRSAVLPHSLIHEQDAEPVLIDAIELNGLIAKFARGSHCYLEKEPLPTLTNIAVSQVYADDVQRLASDHRVEHHEIGPGFTVLRLVETTNDGYTARYAFSIWQSLNSFADFKFPHPAD